MTSQHPAFPCTNVPESAAACRLLGLYQQRQEGMWMQRVKILGGILTYDQWACLAEMCRRYTPSAPLLLTTRQDIEFHNVAPETIPLLQAGLSRAGLSCIGACGDTLRNITLCPGNGLCRDTPDLIPVAEELHRFLETYSGIYSLPRKFKMSFSACAKACAQPWINDLGFIISPQNGSLNVTAIGAGSLGSRPETGMILYENLPVEDICALALAAIRVFNAHGDRKNRGKARLRHVRERIGNAHFLEILNDELFAVKNESLPPMPSIVFPNLNLEHVCDLNLLYGRLSPDQAEALAELMRSNNVVVRPQTHHRISLFAPHADTAHTTIDKHDCLKQLVHGTDIVSCPGTTYCSRALVNTHAIEKALREQIPDATQHAIRISGCPNSCAQSAVADVGLTGRIRKDASGSRVEGFSMVIGGGMGKTAALAEKYAAFVASAQIVQTIKKLIGA